MLNKRGALVVLALRVPEAHAAAVRAYAETLARTTRLRVSPSAAGAAVLETGLVALGLIEASQPTAKDAPKRSPRARKKRPERVTSKGKS